MSRTVFLLAAIPSAVLLASCGGGGGGAPAAPADAVVPAPASLSGASFKGPTAGATVCAFAIDNTKVDKKGAQVEAQAGSLPTLSDGCVVTANDGTYTFVLPTGHTGDMLLESTGGTYCSDESVFNGTVCAGGGTPVAMGANKLKTVAAAPAGGVVASVPLTVLTTAAVANPATLSATNFNTAYATVAGNFGLTDTNPGSDPNAAGGLKTALTNLATYIGGDTSLLSDIVTMVSGGTLTGSGSTVSAEAAINCEALTVEDMSYPYTYTPYMYDPILMMSFPMPPVTTTQYLYALGTSGTCIAAADGLTSKQIQFYGSQLSTMFGTSGVAGTYQEYRYAGSTCHGEYTYGNATAVLKSGGTQALALSASSDPTKSQAGTVTKLIFTIQPSTSLGNSAVVEQTHLFCRTRATTSSSSVFQGYMTQAPAVASGTFTRVNGTAQMTGWTD